VRDSGINAAAAAAKDSSISLGRDSNK